MTLKFELKMKGSFIPTIKRNLNTCLYYFTKIKEQLIMFFRI